MTNETVHVHIAIGDQFKADTCVGSHRSCSSRYPPCSRSADVLKPSWDPNGQYQISPACSGLWSYFLNVSAHFLCGYNPPCFWPNEFCQKHGGGEQLWYTGRPGRHRSPRLRNFLRFWDPQILVFPKIKLNLDRIFGSSSKMRSKWYQTPANLTDFKAIQAFLTSKSGILSPSVLRISEFRSLVVAKGIPVVVMLEGQCSRRLLAYFDWFSDELSNFEGIWEILKRDLSRIWDHRLSQSRALAKEQLPLSTRHHSSVEFHRFCPILLFLRNIFWEMSRVYSPKSAIFIGEIVLA